MPLDDMKQFGDCDIVGVCGTGPEISVESVASSCRRVLGRDPTCFPGDYRSMLDSLKPEILVVCGPFEDHAAMTVEAVSRGIHVFCEKPEASTLEGLAELVKVHEANPRIKIAQMCRPHYDAGMWSATCHVAEIGNVRLLSAACFFEFDGGVSATATVDYLRPENPSIGHGDDRIRVMGTSGSIEVRDGKCQKTSVSGSETYADARPCGESAKRGRAKCSALAAGCDGSDGADKSDGADYTPNPEPRILNPEF